MSSQLDPRFVSAWTPSHGDGVNMEKTGSLLRTASPVVNIDERVATFEAFDRGPNALKRIALAMQAPLKNEINLFF